MDTRGYGGSVPSTCLSVRETLFREKGRGLGAGPIEAPTLTSRRYNSSWALGTLRKYEVSARSCAHVNLADA